MIHVSSYGMAWHGMRKIARIAVFTALIGFLMTACPADVENKTPDPGTVAVPTANPASGAVPLNTEITLEPAPDGAQIYYTLDGTIPTTGDNLYAADNKPVITAAKRHVKQRGNGSGIHHTSSRYCRRSHGNSGKRRGCPQYGNHARNRHRRGADILHSGRHNPHYGRQPVRRR